jgi:hypothetical protein
MSELLNSVIHSVIYTTQQFQQINVEYLYVHLKCKDVDVSNVFSKFLFLAFLCISSQHRNPSTLLIFFCYVIVPTVERLVTVK